MLVNNYYVIREKSSIIPIKEKLSTSMKESLSPSINEKLSPKGEYSLKQNFFDPSKSSPPNDFMIKLHMRMNKYQMEKDDDSFDMK
jgi:hypothetical protein